MSSELLHHADGLTDAQSRAVVSPADDLLVIAGAGSGKTRVMVQRIAHLIRDRGMSPASIAALTFTRRAAGELLSRLRAELAELDESIDLREMLVGTFHSVAYRILRAHGAVIGYDAPPTILEPWEADAVLFDVARDLGYLSSDGRRWRGHMSGLRLRRDLERVYCGESARWSDSATIIGEYRGRMLEWRCLDFGLILAECNRLFTAAPHILAAFRAQVRAVLVDELQDADTTQYIMHDWFAPPASFTGVGDRRQTIYRFRGARPELMQERHPDAEVVELPECFRCGDAIVGAANRLIAHNADTRESPMIGATGRRGRVDVLAGDWSAIVGRIADWRRQGYRWSDIAVLARRHQTLIDIEGCLRETRRNRLDVLADKEADIPSWHRVGGGLDLCDTDPFRELLCWMRVAVNPRDRVADVWLSRVPRDRRYDARVKIQAIRDAGFGLAKAVELLADPLSPEAIYWIERFPEDCRIADALAVHAMRDAQDDLPVGDAVTLSTIHAAKGLEWPCVLVAGCDEGEFPSALALREPGGVEDERRLMYVAMTRAKERLTLHCGSGFGDGDRRPSRFIGEAGL